MKQTLARPVPADPRRRALTPTRQDVQPAETGRVPARPPAGSAPAVRFTDWAMI